MFKIYLLNSANYPTEIYNDANIYNPIVFEPELEMNGDNGILIGKLTFKLHEPSYSPDFRLLQNTVIVTQMISGVETVIFRGRPLLRDDDDYNDQDFTFEGILAGLNDTLQTPSNKRGVRFYKHFKNIVDWHNHQVQSISNNRQIDYSKITNDEGPNPDSYMYTITERDPVGILWENMLEYTRYRASTMDHIKSQYVEARGGFFYLENEPLVYDSNGCVVLHNYLKYIDIYNPDQTHVNTQRIEFGKNLISIKRSASADDFATVLVPLGKQLTDVEKSWPYYQSVENNKVRKIVSSPDDAVLENYNSTNAYINSETGRLVNGGGSAYAILNDVDVEYGDVFYLTTYLEGISTDTSIASYAIIDRATGSQVFNIGPTVRNSNDSTGKLVLKDERIEIPTPEDDTIQLKLRTAYMISANDPNGGYILKKFNSNYQEENVTIMSADPQTTGTIRKTGRYAIGRDVYPDATDTPIAPESYEQSKRLVHHELYEAFGAIEKSIELTDYGFDKMSDLVYWGSLNLERMGEDLEIEIQAADLSYIDETQEPFQPYDLVPVYSEPHGIDMILPIVKMTLPLADPAAATYTLQNDIHLSEDSKKYISQMVSSPGAGTQKNQTVIIYSGGGSSGGGGGGEVPVRELPNVTAADNGKVLGVVDGQWAVKEDATGDGSGGSDINPTDIFRTVFTTKSNSTQRSITNGNNVAIAGQVLADLLDENHGGCKLLEIDTSNNTESAYEVDEVTSTSISFYRIADGKRHVITVPLNSNQGTYSVSDVVDIPEQGDELPAINPQTDEGKVLGVVNGVWAVKDDEDSDNELPEVTTLDNGKVLGVVNGVWAVKDDETGDTLPEIDPQTDEGKVLGIVNGEWAVKDDETGDTLPEITSEYDEGKVLRIKDGEWVKARIVASDVNAGISTVTFSNGTIYIRNTDGNSYSVSVGDTKTFLVEIDKPRSGDPVFSKAYSEILQAIYYGNLIKYVLNDESTNKQYVAYNYSLKYIEGGIRTIETTFLDDVDVGSESIFIANIYDNDTYSLEKINLTGESSASEKFIVYYAVDTTTTSCKIIDSAGNVVYGYTIKNLIETSHNGCFLVVTDSSNSNHKIVYALDEYTITSSEDVVFYRISNGFKFTITIPHNSSYGAFASESLASISGAVVYNASQSLSNSDKRVARRNIGLNGYAIGLRHMLYSGQQSSGSFYAILADGTVSSSPLSFSDIWNAYYSNDKCFIFAYDDDGNVYKLKHISNDSIVLNRVDGSTEYLITMSLRSGENPSSSMVAGANKSSVPIGGSTTLDGAVLYNSAQTLTNSDKQLARNNIGAASSTPFHISLSYNSTTDTWSCDKSAEELNANMGLYSQAYYNGYRYYLTSLYSTGAAGVPVVGYYAKQVSDLLNKEVDEFEISVSGDAVSITRRIKSFSESFEIPVVYSSQTQTWSIDSSVNAHPKDIYENYDHCVLTTNNKRVVLGKWFRNDDPADQYVELFGRQLVVEGTDNDEIVIWKVKADANTSGSVTITRSVFSRYIQINYNSNTNMYSTSITGNDLVTMLPDVTDIVVDYSGDIFTLDSYKIDDGHLVYAIFTKTNFGSGVVESEDAFYITKGASGNSPVNVAWYNIPGFLFVIHMHYDSENQTYYVDESGESIIANAHNSVIQYVLTNGKICFYQFAGSEGVYYRYVNDDTSTLNSGNVNRDCVDLFIPSDDQGNTIVNVSRFSSRIRSLPAVTSSDNGKILGVVNGQWTVANPDHEPTRYDVWLNDDGTLDRWSSDLTFANVDSHLNDAFGVYLRVHYKDSIIDIPYINKIQIIPDVEPSWYSIIFSGTIGHGGTDISDVVFELNNIEDEDEGTLSVRNIGREDSLYKTNDIVSHYNDQHYYPSTVAVYNQFQRKPAIVWEVTDVSQGLLALNTNISSNLAWQLTNLNLVPFKRIKIYSRAGRKTGATAQDSSITPASIIEMSLDNRAIENVSQNVFIGSSVVQNPNDQNRLGILTCAVSADKTKFAVVRATTLYGTAATNNNDAYPRVFMIEGYYD